MHTVKVRQIGRCSLFPQILTEFMQNNAQFRKAHKERYLAAKTFYKKD